MSSLISRLEAEAGASTTTITTSNLTLAGDSATGGGDPAIADTDMAANDDDNIHQSASSLGALPPATPLLTQWTWRQLIVLGANRSTAVTTADASRDDDDKLLLKELSVASWWNKPESVNTGKTRQNMEKN